MRAAKVCWECLSLTGQESTGVQSNWSKVWHASKCLQTALSHGAVGTTMAPRSVAVAVGERTGSTSAWYWVPLFPALFYAVSSQI